MHEVEGRPGPACRRNRRVEAGYAASHVYVHVGAVLGRVREHALDLRHVGPGRVGGPETDPQRTLVESPPDHRLHLGDLRLCGRPEAADARGKERGAGIVQNGHARLDVPDAHAVVDDLAAVALVVPGVDVTRADLELERGRDAVAHHQRVRLLALAVLVQVDESRRHDQASRIDDAPSVELCICNLDDRAVLDADVAHGVET